MEVAMWLFRSIIRVEIVRLLFSGPGMLIGLILLMAAGGIVGWLVAHWWLVLAAWIALAALGGTGRRAGGRHHR